MTLEQAKDALNPAIDSYSAARQQLADARFCAANGMGASNLPFLEMQTHTKYHAMVRAHQNLSALQPPPAPKPVIVPPQPAPKPVATVPIAPTAPAASGTEKIAPVIAHQNAVRQYHEAKANAERARAAFQAADNRLQQAHNVAVAAAQARHDANMSG